MEGNFSKNPPPLWKFQLSFIHHILVSQNPPTPQGNSNPFCGRSMDIFWNCTIGINIF